MEDDEVMATLKSPTEERGEHGNATQSLCQWTSEESRGIPLSSDRHTLSVSTAAKDAQKRFSVIPVKKFIL